MTANIVCIVEGFGEVDALPVLLRRILGVVAPSLAVQIRPPIRQNKSSLLAPHELDRALKLARRAMVGPGAVLLLLDADDDCPAVLGPQLAQLAQASHGDLLISVVVAKCEFEAWFLAAAPSLRGERGLPPDLEAPPNPEGIRGAKQWLARQMPFGYSPTVDQARLAAKLDLDAARAAPSFDKLWREVTRIAQSLQSASRPTS